MWDRGNSYIAPNAYDRAVPLGAIEAFDCKPAGGEQRDATGSQETSAPPCFEAPPLLWGNQKFPRLRRGKAPLVPAPKGRAGTAPATP